MKLSIITINLNNAEGLRKTLDSVAAQTFGDYEHIIIDGASTDSSVGIIEEYASQAVQRPEAGGQRPIIWVSEPDKGIYNAMNKGILRARGEYCLFLNSGDYLVDGEVLGKVFALGNNEDFFLGGVLYGSETKGYHRNGLRNLNFSAFQLFQCSVPHQACFIKRSLLIETGGYDENYKIVSDLKFFYQRIIRESRSIACIDVVVSVVDDKGISSNLQTSRVEEDRLFLEFYPKQLLTDYYDWQRLKEENAYLKRNIKENEKAIYIYESIRNRVLLRKMHTMVYRFLKKRQG